MVPLAHFLPPTGPHSVQPFAFREGDSRPTDLLLLRGLSATLGLAGLGQPSDLIIIDGDHRYEAVRTDTRRVFEHLAPAQAVVVWPGAGWPTPLSRLEVEIKEMRG